MKGDIKTLLTHINRLDYYNDPAVIWAQGATYSVEAELLWHCWSAFHNGHNDNNYEFFIKLTQRLGQTPQLQNGEWAPAMHFFALLANANDKNATRERGQDIFNQLMQMGKQFPAAYYEAAKLASTMGQLPISQQIFGQLHQFYHHQQLAYYCNNQQLLPLNVATAERDERVRNILQPSPLLGEPQDNITPEQEEKIKKILDRAIAEFDNNIIPKPKYWGAYPKRPLTQRRKILLLAGKHVCGSHGARESDVSLVIYNSLKKRGHEVFWFQNDEIDFSQERFEKKYGATRIINGKKFRGSPEIKKQKIAEIYKFIEDTQPQWVITSNILEGDDVLNANDLLLMKQKYNLKMMNLLTDYYQLHSKQIHDDDMEKVKLYADLSISVFDSHPNFHIHLANGMAVHIPHFPYMVNEIEQPKKYNFYFSGYGYKARDAILADMNHYISDNNISLNPKVSNVRDNLYETFINSLQMARFTMANGIINDTNRHILTARVFESMTNNCLVFNETNDMISDCFAPFVHYVPFFNRAELIIFSQFLVKNPQYWQNIVTNASNACLVHYHYDNFWTHVEENMDRIDNKINQNPMLQPKNPEVKVPHLESKMDINLSDSEKNEFLQYCQNLYYLKQECLEYLPKNNPFFPFMQAYFEKNIGFCSEFCDNLPDQPLNIFIKLLNNSLLLHPNERANYFGMAGQLKQYAQTYPELAKFIDPLILKILTQLDKRDICIGIVGDILNNYPIDYFRLLCNNHELYYLNLYESLRVPRVAKILAPSPLLGASEQILSIQNEQKIRDMLDKKHEEFANNTLRKPEFQGFYNAKPLNKNIKIFLMFPQNTYGSETCFEQDNTIYHYNAAKLRGYDVRQFNTNKVCIHQARYNQKCKLPRICDGKLFASTAQSKQQELQKIREHLQEFRPDVVLCDSIYAPNEDTLTPADFMALKKEFQFKLVFFYSDGWYGNMSLYSTWAECADAILTSYQTHQEYEHYDKLGKIIHLPFVAFDFQLLPKKFDLFFWGRNHRNRDAFLSNIEKIIPNSIIQMNNYLLPGREVSCEKYYELLLQSRITFSSGFTGQYLNNKNLNEKVMHIITSRFRESIFSKTLILEESHLHAQELYYPYIHFIPVNCRDEVILYSQFFIKNPDYRDKIVNQAYQFMEQNYSNEHYWTYFEEKLHNLIR